MSAEVWKADSRFYQLIGKISNSGQARMRRWIIALSLAIPALVRAQDVRVVDDQRAEVIGILFRIAGASDFTNGTIQPYIRQIDSAFLPLKHHPVFSDISQLRATSGLSLSAVISLAPHLTDAISFRERAPIDAPLSSLPSVWRGAEARTVLADARDFARVAKLQDFLDAHQALYDSASARMQRLVASSARLGWFSDFFGEPASGVFVISPLLINSTGNFAAEFGDGSKHERYAYLGIGLSDSLGFPLISPSVIPTLVHELNHTFVNHVVSARAEELRVSATAIHTPLRESMSANGYDNWLTMIQESVVRASVIRYLRATAGQPAAYDEMAIQRGLGFIWMDQLVALLGQYEADRRHYPTLTDFMPRIVAFYNHLAPGIDSLRTDFERHRPRVVSASILDGATDVDPRSGVQLVLRFDQPVESSVNLVQKFCCGIPEFTAASFDSSRTTLTLMMKLEGNRDYNLPLGPAFRSLNGYPLQRFMLRFHTRLAPAPSSSMSPPRPSLVHRSLAIECSSAPSCCLTLRCSRRAI
jgi:hypothetical protein